ncbi:unnamed protein product [Camellia sinensis]
MGLVQTIVWMNSYSKRQCRSLFWRLKKAVKNRGDKGKARGKQQFKFQYDPSSYALNFDNGDCGSVGEKEANAFHKGFPETTNTWAYVLWLDTYHHGFK